jgi:enhancer of polycomb-like protein
VPYAERLFKYIAGPRASRYQVSSSDDDEAPRRDPHALRLRSGRGGRVHLDRRRPPSSTHRPRADFAIDGNDVDEHERLQRLRERWRFDEDDGPALGPEGPEEHDRALYDDYQPK